MLLRKSYSWWWDSHNSSRRSPWLQSTLSELDVKTKAMLQLIEEDADSFAQRAEMYYKKRPELVNMVEDFYRAHRSLAERYDQLKSDLGNRYPEPIFSIKNLSSKSSEVSDSFDSEESEVDDPEPEEAQDDPEPEETQIEGCKNRGNSSIICSAIQVETCTNCENNIRFDGEETQVDECENKENSARFDSETQVKECKNRENGARIDCETQVEECKNTGNGPGVEVSIEEIDSELAEVRKEIERLREENRALRAELEEKNEDKREVIRQLCLSVEMLKEEKASLRKCIKDSKKWSLFEFYKWKGVFSGNLFNGFAMFQPGMVAL